jgi:hypothetical protein
MEIDFKRYQELRRSWHPLPKLFTAMRRSTPLRFCSQMHNENQSEPAPALSKRCGADGFPGNDKYVAIGPP